MCKFAKMCRKTKLLKDFKRFHFVQGMILNGLPMLYRLGLLLILDVALWQLLQAFSFFQLWSWPALCLCLWNAGLRRLPHKPSHLGVSSRYRKQGWATGEKMECHKLHFQQSKLQFVSQAIRTYLAHFCPLLFFFFACFWILSKGLQLPESGKNTL